MRDKNSKREQKRKESTTLGILSCCFFIISIALFAFCTAVSYAYGGSAGTWIGLGGVATIILSVFGLFFGLEGRKQKGDYIHLADKFGIGANVILLAAMLLLFIIGAKS